MLVVSAVDKVYKDLSFRQTSKAKENYLLRPWTAVHVPGYHIVCFTKGA